MQSSTPELFQALTVPEKSLPFEVSGALLEAIAEVSQETSDRVRYSSVGVID